MIRSRQLDFSYETKVETEAVGAYRFDIIRLLNLDQTIDGLFELLRKSGEEALLERFSPYFGMLWPSSRALALELLAMPLRGKRVTELGCGLALPSLVSAKMGARVMATDTHPDVPAFLEANLRINQLPGVEYRSLDWSDSSKMEKLIQGSDWVVASDVLYEKQQPEQLAQVLVSALERGVDVRIADPGRPYLQAFSDAMERAGYPPEIATYTVPDGTTGKEIFILKFS